MGQRYQEITDKNKAFIEKQKIFFVGTAAQDGRVNISPKGMDSLRILGKNQVVWLNMTGSGNETAAHVQENNRMTLMFAAFEGNPLILRIYGQAECIHKGDSEWEKFAELFPAIPGARQIFNLHVDLVQASCGTSVPLYHYVEDRDQLAKWAAKKGDDGIRRYWKDKNQISLDGKPTLIIEKST